MTAFEVITLFPDVVDSFVRAGVLGKAIERDIVKVHCTNPRDFTRDKHRTVDDAPFGGGAGMVMKPEPLVAALEHVSATRGPAHRILLAPSAPRFDQRVAERLAVLPRIALVCGRYEGVDERVREHFIDEALSIGDFVLGGGEVAALVVIEAVSRLVEGVLGNPDSAAIESFSRLDGGEILEFPQYTRPAEFRGHTVPPVLLGGDHGAVERWRRDAAKRRTWALRPDLRPKRTLPEDLPVHLAIPAAAVADAPSTIPAWVEIARRHGVAGVALLGGGVDDVVAWAAHCGGKLPVTAHPSLSRLRRRLGRGASGSPWLVGLVDPPPEPSPAHEPAHAAASTVDTLLDALPSGEPSPPPCLVLVIQPPDADQVDALFAPEAGSGLAIPSAIVESSPPKSAAVADMALGALLRARPLEAARES